jgi:hypothetical protein
MNIKDYTTVDLISGIVEYTEKLRIAQQRDKRYKQTKLDITFYSAMLTLYHYELVSRAPF